MINVISHLTDKPEWYDKVYREDIVQKWRSEMLELPDFTEKMVDWVGFSWRSTTRSALLFHLDFDWH